ncbi:hypothetical protein ACIOGZ_28155 [Kitasatospora sp. NPDC088160]|uniref:pPIWI_RE_Y domain-containing protein n=1 Tax=Kitasatospora sp. NPDC088160 TaxID=3364072 RepID=UPI00382E5340
MTSDGIALLRELAEVVCELGEEVGLRSFLLPYPPAAQRVLDRMVLHCMGLGLVPPKSLPELIEWCRCTLAGDRPFEVPPALVFPDAALVDRNGLLPTRTCLELASAGAEGGPEKAAHVLLSELAGRCGSMERFHKSRRFLALNPVVRHGDRFQRSWSKEIWSRVKDLYRPVPESLTVEGTLLRCGTCRLPALLGGRRVPDQGAVSGSDTWCEGESCPHGIPMELIRTTDGVLLLGRPLRAFLSLPFRLEQAVLADLDRAAVGYQALPNELSAYRLQGAGLSVRQLHIHDRVQPALLAERFSGATGPVLVVVPEDLAGVVRYRNAFTQALSAPEQVLLTGPGDLGARLRGERAFGETEMRGEGSAQSDADPA